MNELLIISTTDSFDLAREIAAELVSAHEAACVNILQKIHSIYRWEGKLCTDEECLLLIKSSREKYEAVRARIRSLHTYQVPEIIALPIVAGDPDYLSWLRLSLEQSGAAG